MFKFARHFHQVQARFLDLPPSLHIYRARCQKGKVERPLIAAFASTHKPPERHLMSSRTSTAEAAAYSCHWSGGEREDRFSESFDFFVRQFCKIALIRSVFFGELQPEVTEPDLQDTSQPPTAE